MCIYCGINKYMKFYKNCGLKGDAVIKVIFHWMKLQPSGHPPSVFIHHHFPGTKMRSLRGTAIFQITKYPQIFEKSGNGCWKQDDQGQIFLRGTELVNRCQIWQSWHNWGGESTKRPVEASYRPLRCEKCFHFPPKLLIFFTLVTPICSTNMSHFPRPWSSFTPHWFKHFGLSQAQHPRIYFQTRLLSDCKRKAISGPRLDRNNGQLQLLFGPCPLPEPIAQASSSSSAFRGFPIG